MEKYDRLLDYIRYYRAILITTAVVSSICFPYMIYLILIKSPKLMSNTIKFNMLHVVTDSYLITMLIALFMPVEVVPMSALFDGILVASISNVVEGADEIQTVAITSKSKLSPFILAVQQNEPSLSGFVQQIREFLTFT
uniref:G protein-coupled receptor n=1 Tax=Ditylenchus dipsaci TaxID=166011 RepID=A0A915DVX2_9BILA